VLDIVIFEARQGLPPALSSKFLGQRPAPRRTK
jgi:hypothetical protein